ncbi:hypothetical protein vBRpoSV10_232 [Ruegeria phage vB_RpoS-V10]|nr:hypothetical protein vBRpoSV10_232 [Ruegeria phage vB_RpoS-V10]
MAYITTEEVAEMRARLKAAFPLKDGWKFSLTKEHHSSVNFRFMAGPHEFMAFDVDQYSLDPETPKCRAQAEAMGKFKAVTNGSVNHYWIADHWTPESAAILQKASDIIHLHHWDKSDIQSDYFHCAFYVSMGIGRWDKPYTVTAAPVMAQAA